MKNELYVIKLYVLLWQCPFAQISDKLILEKISCPLGVLLIIFESRPDALVQVILRLLFLLIFLPSSTNYVEGQRFEHAYRLSI